MLLFQQYLDEVTDYAKENTRLMFLGDKTAFDEKMQKRMMELEKSSASFDGMTLM